MIYALLFLAIYGAAFYLLFCAADRKELTEPERKAVVDGCQGEDCDIEDQIGLITVGAGLGVRPGRWHGRCLALAREKVKRPPLGMATPPSSLDCIGLREEPDALVPGEAELFAQKLDEQARKVASEELDRIGHLGGAKMAKLPPVKIGKDGMTPAQRRVAKKLKAKKPSRARAKKTPKRRKK